MVWTKIATVWRSLVGRPKAAPTPIAAGADDGDARDPETDLRERIRVTLRAGFMPTDVILEQAVDYATEGKPSRDVKRLAHQVLAEECRSMQEEQRSWPVETDCDRLDAAFRELETAGIVARHDFTCCGNCGVTEIGEQMDGAARRGRPVRGYAFYHEQDTERAVDGGPLYLNYGAAADGEAAALEVGGEIVRCLSRHGLTPQWDGSWKQRIAVAIEWRRRRREAELVRNIRA